MTKVNFKNQIQNILDNTDLDEKLVKELNELKEKAEKIETALEEAGDFVEEKAFNIKSFFKKLKATLGFWSIVEVSALLFMVIPAIEGDFNVAFAASLVYVLMHKFNINWIK